MGGRRRPPAAVRGARADLRNYRTIFAAPAVSAALLVGMVVQSATRATPAMADVYHARAKAAIDGIPTRIGNWTARNEPVPREALALLKPNEIRCLKYVDNDTADPTWPDRWAILLVDQCRDARDMSGHYPPNCYVNSGEEQTDARPRTWVVDGFPIVGTEYEFRQTTATASMRTAVYNFLVVPDHGLMPDMSGFNRVAENYPRRFYGAAQFQVVMNADLPEAERDEMFTTVMGPCVPVIRTLLQAREDPTARTTAPLTPPSMPQMTPPLTVQMTPESTSQMTPQTPATTRPAEGPGKSSGDLQ